MKPRLFFITLAIALIPSLGQASYYKFSGVDSSLAINADGNIFIFRYIEGQGYGIDIVKYTGSSHDWKRVNKTRETDRDPVWKPPKNYCMSNLSCNSMGSCVFVRCYDPTSFDYSQCKGNDCDYSNPWERQVPGGQRYNLNGLSALDLIELADVPATFGLPMCDGYQWRCDDDTSLNCHSDGQYPRASQHGLPEQGALGEFNPTVNGTHPDLA